MTTGRTSLTHQQKVLTLAGMLLAMFLAALDQTVVATAGPTIMHALNVDAALYTWMTTSYLVASTVLVPVYGRLSDVYGRKTIIVLGVALFLVGSTLCGLAATTGQLIAFRAIQGAGSASIFTSAFAIIADLFTPAERGRYSGLFGAVFGVSSLVGPLLGGFITDQFGWHWVFFVNLPLGGLALAFILFRMPALRARLAAPPSVDFVGAALLAVGVVPLLIALTLGRPEPRAGELAYAWLSWQELTLLFLATAGLGGFVTWELRTQHPLVDLRLFREKTVRWGSAVVFVMGGVFLTPMVFLPLFMVNVVGVTATASGLTISPLVLGVVAGNIASGQLVSRLGHYKVLMLASLAMLMVGLMVMAFTVTPSSTQGEVTAKMVLLGVGLGPSIPLYTIAIQNSVPPERIGVTTSMVTFFRQMGSAVGLAIVGSLFATSLTHSMHEHLAPVLQQLPPVLASRVQLAAPAAGGSEAASLARFDAAAVKRQAFERLEGARSVAAKALDGERLASMLVEQSELASDELKAVAAAGGLRQYVQQQLASTRAHLETACLADDLWASARRQDWPTDVAPLVQEKRPDCAELHESFEQLEGARTTRQHAQLTATLDAELAKATATLDSAIDAAALAIKDAFTEALRKVYLLALALTALALGCTALLPQLDLRRRHTESLADEPPGATLD